MNYYFQKYICFAKNLENVLIRKKKEQYADPTIRKKCKESNI